MDKGGYSQHISQQYNEELEEVKRSMLEMGGQVEQLVIDAVSSIIEGDSSVATQVRENDKPVNAMESDIDEECARILARRQPAASDLRLVLAVTRVSTDLERIGDEAGKIALQTIELAEAGKAPGGYSEIQHMGSSVRGMLHDALDAFARMDETLALKVAQQDKEVDSYYGSAMRVALTLMMEDPRNISRVLSIMWALRSLERIGDHARNIAEHVIYLVKGKDVRHVGLKEMAKQVR
ncbi:MAG: phosphate signaling complex protein PhoU [Pseudomonadales bacterium]